MTETELWIEQARSYLKTASRGESGALAEALDDHMTRLDLARIQADLGCGEDCVECSWGSLGGQPLGNEPCKVLALQQAVDDLRGRATNKVAARQEAATLLRILESLPSPRK